MHDPRHSYTVVQLTNCNMKHHQLYFFRLLHVTVVFYISLSYVGRSSGQGHCVLFNALQPNSSIQRFVQIVFQWHEMRVWPEKRMNFTIILKLSEGQNE